LESILDTHIEEIIANRGEGGVKSAV
jgi:hypothetical protein